MRFAHFASSNFSRREREVHRWKPAEFYAADLKSIACYNLNQCRPDAESCKLGLTKFVQFRKRVGDYLPKPGSRNHPFQFAHGILERARQPVYEIDGRRRSRKSYLAVQIFEFIGERIEERIPLGHLQQSRS